MSKIYIQGIMQAEQVAGQELGAASRKDAIAHGVQHEDWLKWKDPSCRNLRSPISNRNCWLFVAPVVSAKQFTHPV